MAAKGDEARWPPSCTTMAALLEHGFAYYLLPSTQLAANAYRDRSSMDSLREKGIVVGDEGELSNGRRRPNAHSVGDFDSGRLKDKVGAEGSYRFLSEPF